MTEQERAAKAIASAQSHIDTFKEMEAVERKRLEQAGPFPISEEHSFQMAGYYAQRVKEAQAMLKTANDEMAALKRPPLA